MQQVTRRRKEMDRDARLSVPSKAEIITVLQQDGNGDPGLFERLLDQRAQMRGAE